MITRARVLLALDESQGDAPDRRVFAEWLGTSESTAYLVAKAFTMQAGRVEDVIGRKKRTTPPVEPKGRPRWRTSSWSTDRVRRTSLSGPAHVHGVPSGPG